MGEIANLKKTLFVFLLSATAICRIAGGAVIYVDDDGPADFNNIQAAIDVANDGDVIEVQPGTYTGDGNRDIDFLGKAITVRGATGDPNNCVIDCQGDVNEPHRGITFVSGEDENSVLEGLTITNGYGPEEDVFGNLYSIGGAIYCLASSPIINNCTLNNNTAKYGGGICTKDYSSPIISDCVIINNSVANYGAGIFNKNNCSPTIDNCKITGNLASMSGGGIFNSEYCNPNITDCTVNNNFSAVQGGGICNESYSNPVIHNCAIKGNSGRSGAGIFSRDYSRPKINQCYITENLNGSGIHNLDASDSEIINCTINNNAQGIYNYNSNPTINHCIITNNLAENGGGIQNSESNPMISYCIINNNNASKFGGGVLNDRSNPNIKNCIIRDNYANMGGGIWNGSWSNSNIINCDIICNSASQYGGIYNYLSSTIKIENCIIWGNTDLEQIGGLPAIVRYSNIQGGYDGEGNIDLDPIFIDDYHLSSSSPCINAGDPNYIPEPNETDLDGDPRVIFRIDIGADEEFVKDSAVLFVLEKNYEFIALGIDSNNAPQVLNVNNYGAFELNWHVSNDCTWLIINPLIGATESLQTDEVTISIDHNNIVYGEQSCQFEIIAPDAENSPQTVTVNLEVLGPVLAVSPARFSFETALDEPNTAGQILSIQNTGYDTLYWDVNIPIDCGWLSASETSGQATGEFDEVVLSIDHNNVERGFYQCEILVSAPGAENSPQVIPVELRVLGIKGQLYVPTDYPTIQAAVDAAVDGDEVIIEPGIYTGEGNYNIDFRGKAISVRSVEPNNPAVAASTIVEPNKFANGFRFYSAEQGDSVIDGLTIRRCINYAAISCSESSPTIQNCIIEDNYYYYRYYVGGGIACYGGSPVISNCVIRNNHCSGLRCGVSSPIVRNCIFSGNRGSLCYSGYGMLFGGGIVFEGGDISIINCTFSGNTADVGGGICSFGSYADLSNMTISNCIFRDNDANDGAQIALIPDYQGNPSTVSVSYSDVQGGEAAIYVEPTCTLNWDDVNNLDADPCFAVPGYWHPNDTPLDANDDFWVDGDYHLKSEAGRWDTNSQTWVYDTNTSACIDAGDPYSDRTGELWPHGMRINMGAYGGTREASMSLSDAGSITDLNWDNSIGYADLIFMGKWLCEGVLLAEDFDRDGFVNFTDFAIFAHNWQGTPGLAGNPYPAEDVIGVDPDADLSWSAGFGATSHDVYFGTSNPPPFICNQTATTYDPGTFAIWTYTKYYWRIDEVNSGGTARGIVWSFWVPYPPPSPP